jgi:hypothetical protein
VERQTIRLKKKTFFLFFSAYFSHNLWLYEFAAVRAFCIAFGTSRFPTIFAVRTLEQDWRASTVENLTTKNDSDNA